MFVYIYIHIYIYIYICLHMEDRMGFICKGEMDAIMDALSLLFFPVH